MTAADTFPQAGARLRPAAIVFDYGNVLSLSQQTSEVERMASTAGIPAPRLQELYWESRIAYDRGDLTAAAYWKNLAVKAGVGLTPAQIRQLVEMDARSWSRPNQQTLRWVAELRRSAITLAVLSNMPLEIKQYLVENCAWLGEFQTMVFSCDVGAVKPSAVIYRKCLASLRLQPEQVVFLDDRQENVEGAQRLGIHAFLFDTTMHTSARLAQSFELPVFRDDQ